MTHNGRISNPASGITTSTGLACHQHHHRPVEAADRSRVGDWEGDLITGRRGLSAIGTLARRKSRYLKLIYLPGRRTAEGLIMGPPRRLRRPSRCRSAHPHLGPGSRDTACYVSTFPRAATCVAYMADDLRRVEERLNTRPRKSREWATPGTDPDRLDSLLLTLVLRPRLESAMEPACRVTVSFRPPLTITPAHPTTVGMNVLLSAMGHQARQAQQGVRRQEERLRRMERRQR